MFKCKITQIILNVAMVGKANKWVQVWNRWAFIYYLLISNYMDFTSILANQYGFPG